MLRLMGFRYREHLILPVVYSDPTIGDWTASVHIEFTQKLKIHTVVLRSDDTFKTEVQAKKFIIDHAKQWVDDRLGSGPASPWRRKRIHSINKEKVHVLVRGNGGRHRTFPLKKTP